MPRVPSGSPAAGMRAAHPGVPPAAGPGRPQRRSQGTLLCCMELQGQALRTQPGLAAPSGSAMPADRKQISVGSEQTGVFLSRTQNVTASRKGARLTAPFLHFWRSGFAV